MQGQESRHAPVLRGLGFRIVPESEELRKIFNTKVRAMVPVFLCITGKRDCTLVRDERNTYWRAEAWILKPLNEKGFVELSFLLRYQ